MCRTFWKLLSFHNAMLTILDVEQLTKKFQFCNHILTLGVNEIPDGSPLPPSPNCLFSVCFYGYFLDYLIRTLKTAIKLEDNNSKVLSPLSYSKYAANARVTIEAFCENSEGK